MTPSVSCVASHAVPARAARPATGRRLERRLAGWARRRGGGERDGCQPWEELHGSFPRCDSEGRRHAPVRPAAFLDSDGDQDASRRVFRLARDRSRAHGCGSAPVSDRLSPARAWWCRPGWVRRAKRSPRPGPDAPRPGVRDAGPRWCGAERVVLVGQLRTRSDVRASSSEVFTSADAALVAGGQLELAHDLVAGLLALDAHEVTLDLQAGALARAPGRRPGTARGRRRGPRAHGHDPQLVLARRGELQAEDRLGGGAAPLVAGARRGCRWSWQRWPSPCGRRRRRCPWSARCGTCTCRPAGSCAPTAPP